MQSLSKYYFKNNFYFFGILLGLSNYFSGFHDLLKPAPIITLVAIMFFSANVLMRKKNEDIPLVLKCLVPLGAALSLIRYYLIYTHENMVMSPILRHTASLTMGLILLSIFIQTFKSMDFQKVSRGVVIGSIPALLFGMIQFFMDHRVLGFSRIQSFYTEPSYYGEYLVLIVLPCLIAQFKQYNTESRLYKSILIIATAIVFLNLVFTQSGTVILRLLTFVFLVLILYPTSKKIKYFVVFTTCFVMLLTVVSNGSYVIGRYQEAYDILMNQNNFFKYHTYYDRFYPIFSSLKTLPDYYFLGTGFGGDYYELKNLYPAGALPLLISLNPSLSFFFSFGPKFFLYFGLLGLFVYYYFFRIGKKCNDRLMMISYFAVLGSSFWGLANFSLPYIWFWLALVLVNQKDTKEAL